MVHCRVKRMGYFENRRNAEFSIVLSFQWRQNKHFSFPLLLRALFFIRNGGLTATKAVFKYLLYVEQQTSI